MLKPTDFDAFYEEVMGYAPYPWQRQYALELCAQGWSESSSWSDRITKPTGSGKTEGVILPWLFALAYQLDQGKRTLPLRLFWTVDRRIIVDEVYRLGEGLKGKFSNAAVSSVCSQVSVALKKTGSKKPFQIVKMRGGVSVDDDWMRDPRTPTLVSTTVDQAGSGLLCRKYGKRDRMWPIYAGLMANESGLVLDESHLSQPFVETLGSIKRMHPKGLFLIQVSATARGSGTTQLTEADRQHPVLGPRLNCSKVATLVSCSKDLEKTLASEALKLGKKGFRIVAVPCNRVKTARKVHEILRKDKNSDAVLFTGRSRQFDRDKLMEELLPYIRTDANRPSRDRTLYIVATQCIEAGADFDFDAMVTECAPLDSLIQRGGRLGRLGDRDVELVIVQNVEDPVYDGQAIVTWEWLVQEGPVDFSWVGQERLADKHGAALEKLMSPPQTAPYLSRDIVKTLSRTNPPALNAPTLERFLHGYDRSPDVTVLWREDLFEEDTEDLERWAATVALCPPVPGESMEIPIWTLRAFLQGNHKPDDLADVAVTQEATKGKKPRCAPFLRWQGISEESELLTEPRKIRPGDVLVLPVSRGGCDEFGWTGDPKTKPEDVADQALRKAGKLRMRVHPGIYKDPLLEGVFKELVRRLKEDGELHKTFVQEVLGHLEFGEALLQPHVRLMWEYYPDGKGVVVFDPRSRPARPRDDADEASFAPKQVLLREHLIDVGHWARVYGESLLHDPILVEALELAGLLHDLGKADPRWQRFIYGGAWKPGADVVAKSQFKPNWNHAGSVKGQRHEYSSLMMAEVGGLLEKARDPDLVAHLLATHHGLGRPFPPPLHDELPVSYSYEAPGGKMVFVESSAYPYAKVDSGWADRYAAIMARYEPWEIMYLEALLRVADWRASYEERKAPNA